MHRFFSPPDRCSSSVFSLSESEARHASQVLRLGPGDHLEILDGQGGLIEAEILASSRKSVEVQVVRRQTVPRPQPGVVLLQALLKGKALETVLEKSVELGVEQLVLLDTDHCVAQVPPAEAARKRSVWTQTLIEAAKQSRNPWLPELLGPLPLPLAFQQWSDSNAIRLFVASLEPGVPTLGRVLRSTRAQPPFRRLAVAVGPEGDFSPNELANFRSAGAVPISLGSLILRAETAAIAAVAILADHARGLDHSTESSGTASTTP